MKWIKGDILYGRKGSDAIHPIVFLEGYDETFFLGAMITSSGSEKYPDNIKMKAEHFHTTDENGQTYEVICDDTYLVKALLLKKLEWIPFRKVGQLTNEGVDFVEKITKEKDAEEWEEYLKQTAT